MPYFTCLHTLDFTRCSPHARRWATCHHMPDACLTRQWRIGWPRSVEAQTQRLPARHLAKEMERNHGKGKEKGLSSQLDHLCFPPISTSDQVKQKPRIPPYSFINQFVSIEHGQKYEHRRTFIAQALVRQPVPSLPKPNNREADAASAVRQLASGDLLCQSAHGRTRARPLATAANNREPLRNQGPRSQPDALDGLRQTSCTHYNRVEALSGSIGPHGCLFALLHRWTRRPIRGNGAGNGRRRPWLASIIPPCGFCEVCCLT
ncbi:hypothetical protein J3F83DRAFT_470881 [Trichoderma novae-zelandiae]